MRGVSPQHFVNPKGHTAMRSTIAALALIIAAGPLTAQSKLVEVTGDSNVPPFTLSADLVQNMEVYAADMTKLGDVEEVLGDNPSTPTAIAVAFEGGLMRGQEDTRVVELSQFSKDGDRLILEIDLSTLEDLPVWND
jgi:hypothetical protein